MTSKNIGISGGCCFFCLLLLITRPVDSLAAVPFRVAVVSKQAVGPDSSRVNTLISAINREIRRPGITTIYVPAVRAAADDLDHLLERPRHNSRYGVDAIITVSLNLTVIRRAEYCVAVAMAGVEGYDSSGRDLGLGDERTLRQSRLDCEAAIRGAVNNVGIILGEDLNDNDKLMRRLSASQNLMLIRLEGAADDRVIAAFSKIIAATRGVEEIRELEARLTPEFPQESSVLYQIALKETDAARLQANISRTICRIGAGRQADNWRGVKSEFSEAARRGLSAVHYRAGTSGEIIFIQEASPAGQWNRP